MSQLKKDLKKSLSVIIIIKKYGFFLRIVKHKWQK